MRTAKFHQHKHWAQGHRVLWQLQYLQEEYWYTSTGDYRMQAGCRIGHHRDMHIGRSKKIHAFCLVQSFFFFEGCLVQTSGSIETTNLRCQVCNHGLWPCCDCGTRIQKGWLVLLVERLFTAEYNRVQRRFVDLFTIFKDLFWRLFQSGYYFTVETEQQSTLETRD